VRPLKSLLRKSWITEIIQEVDNMKKKIMMLLVSATLAIALLGGGVYAYFSDTETSSGNSFTAGSLDLVIGGSGSSSIVLTGLAPGNSGSSSIQLANNGNIAGNLSMTAGNLVDGEGTNWEPETNTAPPGDLSANVDVVVFVDVNSNGLHDDGAGNDLWTGKLSTLPSNNINCGSLAGAGTTHIGFYWSIATSVGNDIMGDTTTFDIVFTLQQP
jgi:spore coat-associated protein N